LAEPFCFIHHPYFPQSPERGKMIFIIFLTEKCHFYLKGHGSNLYGFRNRRMQNYRNIRFHHIEESDLLDFIEQRHHAYAKSMLILMLQNFKSAIASNPRHKDVLQDLKCLLEQLNVQIMRIIALEEESLFPFVRKLLEVRQQIEPVRFLKTGLIQSSINRISAEHDHAIALVHSIKKISNYYTPPEISNELLKLCYEELREFEDLSMSQIFRERKFLFPRILDLESDVLQISSVAATGTSGPGHDD